LYGVPTGPQAVVVGGAIRRIFRFDSLLELLLNNFLDFYSVNKSQDARHYFHDKDEHNQEKILKKIHKNVH
jgi:hypothetical protein